MATDDREVQAAWEAESGLLDRIAHHVFYSRAQILGRHEGFLRKFAAAWLGADAGDKRIIRVAWVQLIAKYSLEAELEAEQRRKKRFEEDLRQRLEDHPGEEAGT